MRARALTLLVAGALIASSSLAFAEGESCAAPMVEAGEWRSYGRDLSNTRNQTAGTVSAATAGTLAPKWTFSTALVQAGGGSFSNTPVVADGCVFLASNSGFVYAVNADTGKLVWKSSRLPGAGQTLLGGVIVGSPVVEDGMVFVGVSRPGTPYVAALDEATGTLLWTAVVEGYSAETVQGNSLINASPVYHNGMIFMGFSGNEGGSVARGGFTIVDASRACSTEPAPWKEGAPPARTCANPVDGGTGGTLLKHTWTINDAEYAAGYRGASIWCTAAIDPVENYAYACGGNPASKRIEHRYSNALLKIDLDPSRDTFGTIVDSYKGDVDQYYPGLDRQPVCDALGDTLVVVWSLACLQLDLDFGSSPNLFRDALGNLMVGDLQKSGIYHTLYADQMQRSWTTVVGAPCAACNASSPAIDGTNIYNVGTPGGVLSAITRQAGRYQWAQPIGDGTHFQPTSASNGAVFTVDGVGTFRAYDGATGMPLLARSLTQDVGESASDTGSQGISIARNKVYVASGGFVVAYS